MLLKIAHDYSRVRFLRYQESIEAMFGFAFGLEDKINQLDKEYKDVISGFYIGTVSHFEHNITHLFILIGIYLE